MKAYCNNIVISIMSTYLTSTIYLNIRSFMGFWYIRSPAPGPRPPALVFGPQPAPPGPRLSPLDTHIQPF